MTLQQQIRLDMADSLQRVREEVHTASNGRLDAISSISSAMQRLSAGPTETVCWLVGVLVGLVVGGRW